MQESALELKPLASSRHGTTVPQAALAARGPAATLQPGLPRSPHRVARYASPRSAATGPTPRHPSPRVKGAHDHVCGPTRAARPHARQTRGALSRLAYGSLALCKLGTPSPRRFDSGGKTRLHFKGPSLCPRKEMQRAQSWAAARINNVSGGSCPCSVSSPSWVPVPRGGGWAIQQSECQGADSGAYWHETHVWATGERAWQTPWTFLYGGLSVSGTADGAHLV
jgi:hypothetical protein